MEQPTWSDAWGTHGTFLAPASVPRDEPLPADRILKINTPDVGAVTMSADGPRDLPGLRSAIRDGWFSGKFRRSVHRSGGDQPSESSGRWEVANLTDAALVWVSSDLTDVVEDLRPSLPGDTTLDDTQPPWPSGFAVFAHPVSGRSATADAVNVFDPVSNERVSTDPTLTVRAVLWGPISVRAIPERGIPVRHGIGISSYDLFDYTNGLSATQLAVAQMGLADSIAEMRDRLDGIDAVQVLGRAWMPLGRSDWGWGEAVDDRLPGITDAQHESFSEDRRLIYTLWHLMREEQIVETSEVTRSKKARQRRSSKPKDRPVTVLHLRRARSDEVRPDGEHDDETGRRIGVRHLVRAHWRQQACGPGRSLRRPILIAPHWRGPEDGPVRVTEKVWSLDR